MIQQTHVRTRVKICGITRIEDALSAASLGVDALGLVFYAKSPRHVMLDQAQLICDALPAFVSRVALFLNPESSLVNQVISHVNIDCLQFHGTEAVEFCESFSKPYIKALGIAGVNDVDALIDQYSSAESVLLDSHRAGEAGGSGEVFDWASISQANCHNIILAGGLNPDNIADAIKQVRPYAVDLSSGVEMAPGKKDSQLMARLMNEVKRVDCDLT